MSSDTRQVSDIRPRQVIDTRSHLNQVDSPLPHDLPVVGHLQPFVSVPLFFVELEFELVVEDEEYVLL